MAAPVYIIDGSQMGDPLFTAVISEQMRVPDRLRVAQSAVEDLKSRNDDLLPVYSMHVPDRLALIDAPDLSPRPSFSHHRTFGHASSMWDLHRRPWNKDANNRDLLQSSLRRSYSDQTFCATPKSTPTHINQPLYSPLVSHGAEATSTRSTETTHPTGLGAIAPNLLSPQNLLQAARKLGQQASHKILRTVTEKYPHRFGFQKSPRSQPDKDQTDEIRRSGAQELWMNSEEESGSNVECMVLRRQMMKMNRRLAALEKQIADRRQNELVLFSLVVSAFMINGWLWIRR